MSKKYLRATLLFLLFVGFGITSSAFASTESCIASGGTCNIIQTVCDDDEVKIDTCGTIITPACCKAKSAMTNATGTSGTIGTGYRPLEKLPFAEGSFDSLDTYFEEAYRFFLIIIVLSAIFMIVIGGFVYLTSGGNTSQVSSAKGIVFNAIIGLILALISWLILNIINPELTNISLTAFPPVPTPSAPNAAAGTPGTTSPNYAAVQPPNLPTKQAASSILANSNITLASSGSCSSGSGSVTPRKNMQDIAAGNKMAVCNTNCPGTPCTDNAIVPSDKMLNAMLGVAKKYKFTVTSLSGGDHSAGSSHYRGTGADIVPSGNKAYWREVLSAFKVAGALGSSFCETPKGTNDSTCNSADHIHLNF